MNDLGLISIFSETEENYSECIRSQIYLQPTRSIEFSISDDLWMAVVNNDLK